MVRFLWTTGYVLHSFAHIVDGLIMGKYRADVATSDGVTVGTGSDCDGNTAVIKCET